MREGTATTIRKWLQAERKDEKKYVALTDVNDALYGIVFKIPIKKRGKYSAEDILRIHTNYRHEILRRIADLPKKEIGE